MTLKLRTGNIPVQNNQKTKMSKVTHEEKAPSNFDVFQVPNLKTLTITLFLL